MPPPGERQQAEPGHPHRVSGQHLEWSPKMTICLSVDWSSIALSGVPAMQQLACSGTDKGSSLVLMQYMQECMDIGADSVYCCCNRL
jgi:hypothetical protein